MTYLIASGVTLAVVYVARLLLEVWCDLLWIAEIEELRRESWE